VSDAQGVTVRALTVAEAGLYAGLRRQMLRESPWAFGADPVTDRRSDAAVVAQALAEAEGKPGYAIIGAIHPGAVPALLSTAVVIQESGPKRRHVASVFSVYTAPQARGLGLGREVMRRVISTAQGWPGVEMLELSVSQRAQAARALYASLGFVAWGRQPDALRVDGESLAEEHMQLRW
jgi:ribosomal protein S18 acetylase RimI-like enzyme